MKYIWTSCDTQSFNLHHQDGKISEFKNVQPYFGKAATFSLTHVVWSAAERTYGVKPFQRVSISQG